MGPFGLEEAVVGAFHPAMRLYDYTFASRLPSPFAVTVNGEPLGLYTEHYGAIGAFGIDVAARVEVTCLDRGPTEGAAVRPARLGVAAECEGPLVRFTVKPGQNALVEIPGQPQLHLFAFAGVHEREPETQGKVHRFEAGRLHDYGELRLQAGETLHVEGGAVFSGSIRATQADGLRLSGRGIVTGRHFAESTGRRRLFVAEGSGKVSVRDLIFAGPSVWNCVLGDCEQVRIDNLKIVSGRSGSDGIDPVGSRQVTARGCYLITGDDCVAVKAHDARKNPQEARWNWAAPVRDVLIEGCTLLKNGSGSAMEIGHECRTDVMENITFRDCDVLAVHGLGNVFCINNGDRATIQNVLWEDIRVEHHYEHLVAFRIVDSRWSKDPRRGHVRGVTLRNLDVAISQYNGGYTHSLIGGYSAEHRIEDVLFENVRLNGQAITSLDQLDLYERHTRNVTLVG